MPNAGATLALTLAVVTALAASALAVVAVAPAPAPHCAGAGASEPRESCAEWTDGCVLCARTPSGPACSTPGIACVRGETRCVRN